MKQLVGSTNRKRVASIDASSAGLVLRVSVVGVGIARPVGPSSINVSAVDVRLALEQFTPAQALVRAVFCT